MEGPSTWCSRRGLCAVVWPLLSNPKPPRLSPQSIFLIVPESPPPAFWRLRRPFFHKPKIISQTKNSAGPKTLSRFGAHSSLPGRQRRGSSCSQPLRLLSLLCTFGRRAPAEYSDGSLVIILCGEHSYKRLRVPAFSIFNDAVSGMFVNLLAGDAVTKRSQRLLVECDPAGHEHHPGTKKKRQRLRCASGIPSLTWKRPSFNLP